MLRLLLCLVWVATAGAALSQPVSVRSGQHEGFVRLVLTFPQPVAWDFGRTTDGYGLRASGAGLRFDLSRVYETIARDRLSAIWVDPATGVLRLGVGCDCHGIAEPFRPGIVVIDIRDGRAPAGSPFEAALQDAGQVLPQLTARRSPRPKARPASVERSPDPTPLATAMVLERAGLAESGADRHSPPAPSVPFPIAAVPEPRASALQQKLLADMATAIAAGHVAPAARLSEIARPATAPRGVAPSPALEDAEALDEARPAPDQLRIRAAGEPPAADMTLQGVQCVEDSALDFATWSERRPWADHHAALRRRISGEFDRPDSATLQDLAHHYLSAGFGAEVMALIRAYPDGIAGAEVLQDLARIVDGRPARGAFAGMEVCDGRAALWAMLAAPTPPAPDDVGAAAMVRAFSELSPELRLALGPDLVERLIAASRAEAAEAIANAVRRLPADDGPPQSMIEARLADSAQDHDRAETLMTEVAASSEGLLAVQALLDLAERHVARGEALAPADLLHLESREKELRGSPEGQLLRRALARALAMAGDFKAALEPHAAQDPPLRAEIWTILAQRGADAEVIALVFDTPGRRLRDEAAPDLRLKIARRLLDLGFPEPAERWIANAEGAEAALLLARSALARRDAREAMRRIAGRDDPEARSIRAQALAMLGDTGGAAAAAEAAGLVQERARLVFLARDWPALDPELGDAAAVRLAALAMQETGGREEGPLAQARRLIAENTGLRADARALVATGETRLRPAGSAPD